MSSLSKSLFYWSAVPEEEEPAVFPAVHRPRCLHGRTAGRHMEAGAALQRDLRVVGAAHPPLSVHHGENRLLEVSENQRSNIQHHIDEERVKEGRKEEMRGEERRGGVGEGSSSDKNCCRG